MKHDPNEKPSPSTPTPPQNSDETVAPKNIPQSELTLRRLEDLLKNNQVTPELLKDGGFESRDQMEQFVQQYRKTQKAPIGPGRDIQVKPGQSKNLRPAENLPGIDPKTSFSNRSNRDRGTVVRDEVRNNTEGERFLPPSDLQARINAYSNSLNRSKTVAPGRARGAGGSGGR